MLYDLSFFIFSLIYLPTLLFKGRLHGDFPERFGIYDKAKERAMLSGKDRIWIQAVSVGEVALCRDLVRSLKEKFPSSDIVISTITKAGNDLAKKFFSKDAIIIYFPLDFSGVVRKVINIIKPRLYIMIETEIWPNLLRALASDSIPSILINGRISDRSIGKYRIAKPFLKNVLAGIDTFCMQDTVDADRIIELGAPPEKVTVAGNMKFDIQTSVNVKPAVSVRELFGLKDGETLFVAGSTHGGEEDIVVDAFTSLSKDFPDLKLLIAPRHIDRVTEIEKIIIQKGFEPVRVSRINNPQPPTPNPKILILDTIGQLNDAYSIASLVFIGGSLVKHGGQNPIEPAVLGRAILFGPYMFNFKYISSVFLKNGAAIQISGKEELIEKCRDLLRDPEKTKLLGENAKKAVYENRGATKKNLETISMVLK